MREYASLKRDQGRSLFKLWAKFSNLTKITQQVNSKDNQFKMHSHDSLSILVRIHYYIEILNLSRSYLL